MTATVRLTVTNPTKRISEYISYFKGSIVFVQLAYYIPLIASIKNNPPVCITISTDYQIFKNFAQMCDCYVDCVENGSVLLKPNVIHVIRFNFWKQKVTHAWHSSLHYLFTVTVLPWSFSKKNGPVSRPHQTVTCCRWIGSSNVTCVFSEPQMREFCSFFNK